MLFVRFACLDPIGSFWVLLSLYRIMEIMVIIYRMVELELDVEKILFFLVFLVLGVDA